ncbi:MAG: succinylglutamate desuccinylase/aspartoacylase family protein [Candidatus Hydrothermarchaeales archaeon]
MRYPLKERYGGDILADRGVNVIPSINVKIGTKAVRNIKVAEYSDRTPVLMPLFVLRGAEDGPILLLDAAVHGNELNGVEIVRKVVAKVDPEKLKGTLLGMPIVNMAAYNAGLRWDPLDQKDMNRIFPGDRNGSLTEQVAYTFFNKIAKNADYIIDFHSAEYPEIFLPHARIRKRDRSGRSLEMINAFGTDIVWEQKGSEGMFQVNAIKKGIPTITIEIGAGANVDREGIQLGIRGVYNVMKVRGMIEGKAKIPEYQILIKKKRSWLRSPIGGIFETKIKLGKIVREGMQLGKIIDPLSYGEMELTSPVNGIVAGLRTHPVVRTGTRLFFLLEYKKVGGKFGIDPKHLIEVPQLPNSVYRKNRLLERIAEFENGDESGHSH